jgi:hypothetical protein
VVTDATNRDPYGNFGLYIKRYEKQEVYGSQCLLLYCLTPELQAALLPFDASEAIR